MRRRRDADVTCTPALLAAALACLVLLAGCAGDAGVRGVAPPAAAPAPLNAADVRWLNRITYAPDTPTLARFRAGGRAGFLEAQLAERASRLPDAAAAAIASLPDLSRPIGTLVADRHAERERINALPDEAAKQAARQAERQAGRAFAEAAKGRLLIRALYSPDQLKEQLVWFWLNHFSVHDAKGQIAWYVADYEEHAIRPHVLGRFRDLVLATATHPAMLEYLDNAQNAQGHVNENYARELMELHTLGVGSGYTQADVQELARVLTGFGVAGRNPPKLRPALAGQLVRRDGFEFNPARHDYGAKRLLGQTIAGEGYAELAQAVDVLVRSPACAHFVSRRLAEYLVADDPPAALVERAAQTFARSQGDLRAVVRVLVTSPEFEASLGHKYRDPMHYLVGALRVTYDGSVIRNPKPVIGALQGMDEGLYGHATPDGYPLAATGWTGSGQIAKRIDVARTIANGNAALFMGPDGTAGAGPAFAQLSNRLYFAAIEPALSARTRQALAQARTPQEWNALLLASPEFSYY